MSRGPGRIERAIRALFDANPDRAFLTSDLVAHCYPGIEAVERKHQVSVLWAAHKVVETDPDWRATQGDNKAHWCIFYNAASVDGTGQADFLQRPCQGWEPYFTKHVECIGFRKRRGWAVHRFREHVTVDHAALCAYISEHHGAGDDLYRRRWASRVCTHIEWRDADENTRARLCADGDALLEAMVGGLAADPSDKCYPEQMPKWEKHLYRYRDRLAHLAIRIRGLMTQNDPDALRLSLADVAVEMDKLVQSGGGPD